MFNYSSSSNSEITCGTHAISDETTYMPIWATLAILTFARHQEVGSTFRQKELDPNCQF